ncbi:hypothetical protein JV197_12760, partial [Vibrio furnissii]
RKFKLLSKYKGVGRKLDFFSGKFRQALSAIHLNAQKMLSFLWFSGMIRTHFLTPIQLNTKKIR